LWTAGECSATHGRLDKPVGGEHLVRLHHGDEADIEFLRECAN